MRTPILDCGFEKSGEFHVKNDLWKRLFTPKNQVNSEIVSQTFHLNFLPFQGHKNNFSTGHFWRQISRSFQVRSQNRGSHLRKGSYLHLTLKIDLKIKIDGTVKYLPRSWSTFVSTIFSYTEKNS